MKVYDTLKLTCNSQVGWDRFGVYCLLTNMYLIGEVA